MFLFIGGALTVFWPPETRIDLVKDIKYSGEQFF